MLDLPEIGLYRTTQPMPGHEDAFPANALVFLGQPANGGTKFVVRPGNNRRNRSQVVLLPTHTDPATPATTAGPDPVTMRSRIASATGA